MHGVLALILAMFLVNQAAAGAWTPNQFVYKPALGARGQTEKNTFDSGLERVDAHLGKYKTLGDPGYATLSEALTTINFTATMLVVPAGTVSVTSNTTIAGNVHVQVLKGGQFSIADGVTLTINGPFTAGPEQVFSWTGTGKVVFGDGAVEKVLCEWWGGKGEDGTNNATALQAAFRAWPRMHLRKGTYRVDNTAIYLDSSNGSTTYYLTGEGVLDSVLKPMNYASGYLFKLNETSGGSRIVEWPDKPRAVFQNFAVDGSGSTFASFLWYNQASFQFNNLHFKYILYGAYGTGYTDGVRMDYVRFLNERTGGWLFKSGGNGDGYYFNQIFGPKIHLWKCAGGEIRNVVGGWIKLEECFNVSVDNWHSENDGADGVPTANLWLEDTHAVVRNCWFYDNWNTDAVYPIYIRDSDTLYNHTNVTIEDCVFLNPMPTTDDLRQDSVYIDQISTRGSVVHLRRNYRYHMKSSASWSLMNKTGIVVKSGDASLNTLLTSIDNQGILSSEVDILNDGAWKVGPPMSTRQLRKSSGAPSFSFLNTSSGYPSTLTDGQTYYYKIAFYNGTGWSAASSESSATPSGASLCVQFQPSAKNVWGILRVWRGTSTGVYTHYADVPMTDCAGPTLYDQGGSLCGFEWKTTPPTPPTADNTMDGYILTNGKRVFYGAAAPSSGEFTAVLGDIVWKTAPAANQTPGWMCTTAGSPGTWKAMASLAN